MSLSKCLLEQYSVVPEEKIRTVFVKPKLSRIFKSTFLQILY